MVPMENLYFSESQNLSWQYDTWWNMMSVLQLYNSEVHSNNCRTVYRISQLIWVRSSPKLIVKLIGVPSPYQIENMCMHAPNVCLDNRLLAIFSEMLRVRIVIFAGYIDRTYVLLMIMVLALCMFDTQSVHVSLHNVHGMCTDQKTYDIYVFKISLKNLMIWVYSSHNFKYLKQKQYLNMYLSDYHLERAVGEFRRQSLLCTRACLENVSCSLVNDP